MALAQVNLGTPPSGLDGDDARSAFIKLNANMANLDAWGITSGVSRVATDLNAATEPGLWMTADTAANKPPGSMYPIVMVSRTPNGYIQQDTIDVVSGVRAWRVYNASTWLAWNLLPALQSTPLDPDDGKAMRVGGFGWGRFAIAVTGAGESFNKDRPSGVYYMAAVTDALPSGSTSGYGVLIHIPCYATAGEVVQFFMPHNSAHQLWRRNKVAGVYQAWVDIGGLGSLSQAHRNVTGSRVLGSTYVNGTSRPITVNALLGPTNGANVGAMLLVNGAATCIGHYSTGPNQYISLPPIIVPQGASYVVSTVNGAADIFRWYELS